MRGGAEQRAHLVGLGVMFVVELGIAENQDVRYSVSALLNDATEYMKRSN